MATIVFVTGGSGCVGRNLIAALRTRGDIVRALARSVLTGCANQSRVKPPSAFYTLVTHRSDQ